MKRNYPVYSLLLGVWLCAYYQGVWTHAASDMADNLLNRDEPIALSGFQVWLFNILGLLYDSIWVAIGTGLFAYHFKDRPTWKYIAIGLFLRYLILLVVMPLVLWKNSLSDLIGQMTEEVPGYELAIQVTLQLGLTIGAAILGAKYGKETPELDPRDGERGYINGVSKKVWALLILSFVSVVNFVTELSIVLIYKFSRDVTSSAYWKATWSNMFWGDEDADGGILKLIFNFMFIWIAWVITFAIFFWGVEAIKNRETEYRILKIVGVFVLIPVAIVGIPLLRNRTWFF